MSETWVAVIIAFISSSALSTLISAMVSSKTAKEKAKADKDNENSAIVIAMRQLYYGNIKRHAKAYIATGHITTEELEDIIEEHRIYHDILGGNGFLDELMTAVKALPIID